MARREFGRLGDDGVGGGGSSGVELTNELGRVFARL